LLIADCRLLIEKRRVTLTRDRMPFNRQSAFGNRQ